MDTLRVNVELYEDVKPSVFGAILSPNTQRIRKWLKPEPKAEEPNVSHFLNLAGFLQKVLHRSCPLLAPFDQ